jgi:probable HAF family extracellular repeat protein
METDVKLKSLAFSLGVAALLCMSTAFAQTYNFQTVNYPDDTFTQLLGINNSNEIAGYHGANVNKGFTYDLSSNTFTSENYPGSQQTQVIGINNNPFKTSGFYILHGKTIGFTDYQGTFTSVEFPKKVFNQLLSQNDMGQAAGYYSSNESGSKPDVPYLYDEFGGIFEVYEIAAAVGGAQATGVNNSSSVCGFYIDANGVNHGWLQIQGHFTVLDYPESTGTQALGLNNQGQVVGSWTDTSGNSHGFVYTVSSSSFESVDDPDGIGTTIVNGINDNGTLVGFYGTAPINSGFVASPTK